MVAWPKALHAVSSAPVGLHVWTKLRRAVTASLGVYRAGMNSLVFTGLVLENFDPQLLALIQTIKGFRAFGSATSWDQFVSVAVGLSDVPPTSPCVVLLTRLHQLGFSCSPSGWLLGSFGWFSLRDTNPTEIWFRVHCAWQHTVAAQLAHRSDFDGLACVDAAWTRKALCGLPAADQALYRVGLAGSLFTNDAHGHWNTQGEGCTWCGEPDSLTHRYWECIHTAPLRRKLAPDAMRFRRSLPAALILRGWAIRSPSWAPWIRYLCALPSAVTPLLHPFCVTQWNDVFV